MASSADTSSTGPTAPTHQQKSILLEQTNGRLLKIVRNHFTTQYATQAPSLSAFRDAVSAHGGTEDDATLLGDFRTHVPLSKYDSYKPFVDRFDARPCKLEDVENLFAPGLPDFLTTSSATSAPVPKVIARYPMQGKIPPQFRFFDPNSKNPIAAIVYCACTGLKQVEDASGNVVQKIPVFVGTGRMARKLFGWELDDDERRLSTPLPYYAAPWAATTISNYESILTVFGLFFLTHRDVDRLYAAFVMVFVDLIRCIDSQWDMIVGSIRDGILPDLEDIDHVREYLQAQLHADPERAAELLEIGPPFSREGWVTRVWPQVRELCTICGGAWKLMLPKVRSIIGPDVVISTLEYAAAESLIGFPYDPKKPNEYVLPWDKVIEFLDISQPDTLENLRQSWEVEVGKHYEVIVTTKHGMWRYHLGDIVSIIGFHPEENSPIYIFLGRKSARMHLPHAQIADFQMVEALDAISSEDAIVVEEFTAVVDDRTLPPTIGFIIESSKPPGPNAHLVPQKLLDAFLAIDGEHQQALRDGRIRPPTIRLVTPGTFSEYRVKKVKMLNTNVGQIKVPLVLYDPALLKWILERVIQEL